MSKRKEQALNALLGRGATYEGDLSFEGRVRVDGVFRGRIYTEARLEVGEGGRVEGEVDAAELVVAGEVEGQIRVRRLLLVEPTGSVRGELDAHSMVVREGASFSATVRVGS